MVQSVKKKTVKKIVSTPKIPADAVARVFVTLDNLYPNARTELTYEGPFQLLIAVILSAQCTDARINLTTPSLFEKYPDALSLSKAKSSEVEAIIKSCGFFRAKTKAIISAAQDLVTKFGREIPRTLEELVTLRGVGRKTASVVLNQAFDLPAIAVDTHVKRVSLRLGWANKPEPEKIESQLKEVVPKNLWAQVNTLLILHGRRICKARKPLCEQCPIRRDCLFYQELRVATTVSGKTLREQPNKPRKKT
jgi:endonuclease-3